MQASSSGCNLHEGLAARPALVGPWDLQLAIANPYPAGLQLLTTWIACLKSTRHGSEFTIAALSQIFKYTCTSIDINLT
jgi:hypothetical protein